MRITVLVAACFAVAAPGCGDRADGGAPQDASTDAAADTAAPSPWASGRASYHYIKSSNTGSSDRFGWSVALSADGSTMAVSAINESSAATGIDGNQADRSAFGAGAVYVFVRSGATWRQQAYVKASNTQTGDGFGWSVALSGDGSTMAVSAINESSAATGSDGDQTDDSAHEAGAVYVFVRAGATWRQQAYVKAPNAGEVDHFGASVALSADGELLAVGASGEDGGATGVDGPKTDTAVDSGAVYLFARGGAIWREAAYIKPSNTGAFDEFGAGVALSSDGATLAVAAPGEDSSTTGIRGNPNNNAFDSGAIYVFVRAGATWSEQAYVKASNTGTYDRFGIGIALSGDGATLAAGADREASTALGIDGVQDDDSLELSGAAYVFARSGATWRQEAYVKASNSDVAYFFGRHLALSADGSILAISAVGDDSPATGIGGDEHDNSMRDAGAIYMLARTGATWRQRAYVKASNPDEFDAFGGAIALSGDGSTLAASAPSEDGVATGVDGDQRRGRSESGAVYVVQE